MSTYRQGVESEIDAFLHSPAVVADPTARTYSTELWGGFARWWEARDVKDRPWQFTPPVPSVRLFVIIARERVAHRRTADGHFFLGVRLAK